MELLIGREPTLLNYADGKAFLGSDVPGFLNRPLCIHEQFRQHIRDSDFDLLIQDDADCAWLERHLCRHTQDYLPDYIPALWSGCRSALVRDPESGKMYRLKGVALDTYNPESMVEEGNVRINGGQKLANAKNEMGMSARFNSVLEVVGIEPVMVPKGIWKYPRMCRRLRPAASVFEVKGDTRLDELVVVLERLALQKMDKKFKKEEEGGETTYGGPTLNGNVFFTSVSYLMLDVGFIAGRLKSLMDRRSIVWGHNEDATNAHWGNIMLYRDGSKLKVNLVDLDMAGGRECYSLSEMRRLHKEEYISVFEDIESEGAWSPREMRGKPFGADDGDHMVFLGIRDALKEGFFKGYSSMKRKYCNEMDVGRLLDIFYMLRVDLEFSDGSGGHLWADRTVDYWVDRMHEFRDYVGMLKRNGYPAGDLSVGMGLEYLRRCGVDTSGMESEFEVNDSARDDFLRAVGCYGNLGEGC